MEFGQLTNKDVTYNDILSNPYLVFEKNNNSALKNWATSKLNNIQISMQAPLDKNVGILDVLYKDAVAKEKKLFQAILQSDVINNEVKNNLQYLFDTEQYAQFMTYYDGFRQNLIQTETDIKTVIEEVKKFYQAFTYKKDDALIQKFFKTYNPNDFLGKTPKDIFQDFKDYVDIHQNDLGLSNQQKSLLQKAINRVEVSYFSQTIHLGDHKFVEEDLISHSKTTTYGGKTKTVEERPLIETLKRSIVGIFRGKTLENAIGNVVLGDVKVEGENIETDTVQVLTASVERDTEAEKILSNAEITYEKIKDLQTQVIDNGGYVIKYSAKAGGETSDIMIKHAGSYLRRIEELRGLLSSVLSDTSSFQNFLFAFANTCTDFIAASPDNWKKVQNVMVQLSVVWMFDDIIPDLETSLDKDKGAAVNFYNIRGYIIPSSVLFQKFKEYLLYKAGVKTEKQKMYVTFNKRGTSISQKDIDYSDVKDAWETVYERGMKSNTLEIKLKGKNLIDALFNQA